MIFPQGLIQTATLGGGGFSLATFFSLLHNKMEYGYRIRLAELGMMAKDMEEVRKIPFRFARRTIVLSLLILYPVMLWTAASLHMRTVIPYHYKYSWFFGLVHGQGIKFEVTQGFVYAFQSVTDLVTLLGSFYFGIAFKK